MANADTLRAGPPIKTVFVGVAGLYIAQSVVGSMMLLALPSVLRQSGASLSQVALTLIAVLPWSLKFLWAPAVERFRLPYGGYRRSRLTVGLVGLVSLGSIIALAMIGPTALVALAVVMTVTSIASATIDIACDGHTVESFPDTDRGWANAAQIGGAYLGAAIGGGAYLVLLDHWQWKTATLMMAGLLLILAMPFLLTPDRVKAPPANQPRQSLSAALKRPEIRSGLVLVMLYVFGQKWAMTMIGPFMIDAKFSLTVLGVINGVGATMLGVLGAAGGGYLVRKHGAYPVMIWALAIQVLAMLMLAALASTGVTSLFVLIAPLAVSATAFAMGFVALYSELMGRASIDQAGVDFTLFQSADALISLVGWQLAALVSDRFGYVVCFASAGVLGVLTLLILPRLTRPRPPEVVPGI